MTTSGTRAWERACLALKLLAESPHRFRGLTLRARVGPVRDTYLDLVNRTFGATQQLHPAMSRDTLLGGLDFAQTLATGQFTLSNGLLSRAGPCILTMAERCPPALAALIAAELDRNPNLSLILLDEGMDPEETAPKALSDRLAFHISLEGIGRLEASPRTLHLDKNTLGSARGETPRPPRPAKAGRKAPAVIADLTKLAAQLGINTLRAPQFAVQTAYKLAAVHGVDAPGPREATIAAELVLAPRATRLPDPNPPAPETPQEKPEQKQTTEAQSLPDDMLIEAVRAVLPAGLLENLGKGQTSKASGSGAGQRKRGNRRGRPLPPRPGRLDGSSRIDLVATLRTAAPWQKLRGRASDMPLRVYPSDIHVKRFEDKSDRLIIFTVDASGSAALARLGEAKGAVELLLARAYATRDHVALIAFRGSEAQLLLPPTRSLVQTKRRLAELPGGGGTPLAHGLRSAAELAHASQRQGLSPLLAVLTDGRANIALDGQASRAQAGQDASAMAKWIRSLGFPTIVLDLGTRPQPALSNLAREMGGTYLALPRGTAERMSETLGAAMDHGLGT
ncbi:MAG: magnesium chelatase subunit D [Pseudomonadota bacterium]